MVYYISGNNLYGQWPWEDLVLNKLRLLIEENEKRKLTSNEFISQAELLQINWSNNLLKLRDAFYVAGAWNSKDKQLIKIDLPVECGDDNAKLLAVSNDKNVIIIHKYKKKAWLINMRDKNGIKILNLNTEAPIENLVKKTKINDYIHKVTLNGDSCLYLTYRGHVYQGILPSYVDTVHCNGTVCDVSCGFEHFVLLTDKGSVYTWGSGRRLQLGHSDISNLEAPKEVEALAGIKITKISCGGWHTLALSESGDLYAWGWNNSGQLGIKKVTEELESYSIPKLVDLFDDEGNEVTQNITDIACGSRHSAILLEDNSVWTTGYNQYGQLGVSEEKYPTVNCFIKVFQLKGDCHLICGMWNTIVSCKDLNNL